MKDFITDIYNGSNQVYNARQFLDNRENIPLEEVLTDDAPHKYGNILPEILIYSIDKHKNNPEELKKISDFSKKHREALDNKTTTLVDNIDNYLKEEARKKTGWGKIINWFKEKLGIPPTEKAYKQFNASLPDKPIDDLNSKINDKNNELNPKKYLTPLEQIVARTILCAQGDKNFPYDKSTFSSCVNKITKSTEISYEDKISSLKEINNIIKNSTALDNKQKENSSKPFDKELKKLEEKGPFASKVKEQEGKSKGGREL